MNDGVLVEALRARDPGALAALYDIYSENLYRYCRTLLAGPDAAQVALRDALIAAEALVGSLADPGMFRPWLYALARGECMRRRTPGSDEETRTEAAPLATVPFAAVAADTAEADLRLVASSAVGALGVEDREVLELTVRHGMTVADLAAVLGTGERYADALLEAATERLRETVTVEILARRSTHDCERAAAILAGFAGELTAQERAQLTRHLARCETCAGHRVRQVSSAKVLGLLPLIGLPETLRVRVLSSFIDPELVPYRRFVAKRVGGLNAAGFPKAGTRREGRLAQAVAGAVAAMAAVATIALVFAQFAGDLRERAADTIAPPRFPAAEVPASPGAASVEATPTASPDGTGTDREASPQPPIARDVAEPVAPVLPARPVALPKPVPLPPPRPPTRPHRPTPSAPPASTPPGASPSGQTPAPSGSGSGGPQTGGTGNPGSGSSGSASPGSGSPGSDSSGSGGSGSGGSGSGGSGSGGHGWGGSPRGGPPPAHWPGRRPPSRDHQHHPRPHRECTPTPGPSHEPSGGSDVPSATPPTAAGSGGRREARRGGRRSGAGPAARPPWHGRADHPGSGPAPGGSGNGPGDRGDRGPDGGPARTGSHGDGSHGVGRTHHAGRGAGGPGRNGDGPPDTGARYGRPEQSGRRDGDGGRSRDASAGGSPDGDGGRHGTGSTDSGSTDTEPTTPGSTRP